MSRRCHVCGGSLQGKRSDAVTCGDACRAKSYRRNRDGIKPPVVTSAVVGGNADLIPQVASLYLRPGMTVADVSYGKGTFWRKLSMSRFDFRPSDIEPRDESVTKADFTDLLYQDSEIDVLVLDPPYLGTDTTGFEGYRDNYRIGDSGLSSMEDVIDLYHRGMKEADRVVRPGGQVWVKCQDGIQWARQHWNHITIYDIATNLGWEAEDLFIVVSRRSPMRWPYQRHSRKNHSYLWVFKRT